MKYLILVSGKLRSGKNQITEYMMEEFVQQGRVPTQDLYAKDLKDYSKNDFKILGDVLRLKAETIKTNIGVYFDDKFGLPMHLKHQIYDLVDSITFNDDNFYEDKTDITRALLQLYGTDIARKRFDEQFWVKRLAERINKSNSDVIMITDVRFPNEIEDIHDYLDGWRVVPVRINRPMDRSSAMNEHVSETALDDYKFWEYIVDNVGTLDDLKDSAVGLVEDILKIK